MAASTLVSLPLKVDYITEDSLNGLELNKKRHIHVETTKYGGRGYFASTEIPAGTTVLSADSPFTSAVFRQYKKDACAYCFKCDFYKPCKIKLTGPLISPLCEDLAICKKLSTPVSSKTAYAGLFFCSPECCDNWKTFEDPFGALAPVLNLIDQAVASSSKPAQESSIPVDTEISQTFIDQYWAENVQPPNRKTKIPVLDAPEHDNARIVAVVVTKAYLLSKKPAFETLKQKLLFYADEFSIFNNLQSNELQLITSFPDLLISHVKVYNFLAAVFDKTPLASFLSVDLFRQVLGSEAGNAFGIWQFPVFLESECLGSSIYPSPSYFNHACEPNVQKQRSGRRMDFVTTRAIQPQEELYISYGMFEECPTEQRQKALLEQWHFKCACPKCSR